MHKPTEFPQPLRFVTAADALALAESDMAASILRLAEALAQAKEAADAQGVAPWYGNEAYEEAKRKTMYAEYCALGAAAGTCRAWSEVVRCRIEAERVAQEKQDALQLDAPCAWEVAS